MKISEMIKELKKQKKEHGDLDIYMEDSITDDRWSFKFSYRKDLVDYDKYDKKTFNAIELS